MNVCEWSQESQASASLTLCRLQPIAHLASMEYPLNVALYSLSTHHGSRFAQLVRPHKQSVEMLYSRFHFQNLVQTISVVMCARYVHLCDPDSFVFFLLSCIILFKSIFVCLQLSVTRVGEERLNQSGDWSTGSWVMLWNLCSVKTKYYSNKPMQHLFRCMFACQSSSAY